MDIKNKKLIPSSFDIIGKIIVLNEKGTKKQAQELLKNYKNIKTILKRKSITQGKYRLRKLTWLAGKRKTETLYREYGYLLKLDPKKVYFSPRESTERQRVSQQVKPKETILVMFSGISPVSITIAKKQLNVNKIYDIELNPVAHKYALENIKINKLTDKIKAYKGDVKKVLPKLNKKFDRIIMPLPKGAYRSLDLAFKYIKRKGIIHLYHWANEEKLYTEVQDLVKKTAKEFKKKIRILRKKKVLPYSPRVWKIVLDIKIV